MISSSLRPIPNSGWRGPGTFVVTVTISRWGSQKPSLTHHDASG
jgi:hypothetical protein